MLSAMALVYHAALVTWHPIAKYFIDRVLQSVCYRCAAVKVSIIRGTHHGTQIALLLVHSHALRCRPCSLSH